MKGGSTDIQFMAYVYVPLVFSKIFCSITVNSFIKYNRAEFNVCSVPLEFNVPSVFFF